jgi:hypothetical protein
MEPDPMHVLVIEEPFTIFPFVAAVQLARTAPAEGR